MPPKAKTDDARPRSAGSTASGKLVIIGILTIAITGAAVSWYFRYNATHGAAKFWGPETARLIRDAPQIELVKLGPSSSGERPADEVKLFSESYRILLRRDVSTARGMTHLRNALLEDRSFDFDARLESPPPHYWRWLISFSDGDRSAGVVAGEDCMSLTLLTGRGGIVSCRPIATGLHEMFDELSAAPAGKSADQLR